MVNFIQLISASVTSLPDIFESAHSPLSPKILATETLLHNAQAVFFCSILGASYSAVRPLVGDTKPPSIVQYSTYTSTTETSAVQKFTKSREKYKKEWGNGKSEEQLLPMKILMAIYEINMTQCRERGFYQSYTVNINKAIPSYNCTHHQYF